MSILPFPRRHDPRAGIVHVMPSEDGGFEVAHESPSGNSWGGFESFASGEAAIAHAYALNRDQYAGACEVSVCAQAIEDQRRAPAFPSNEGGF